MPIDVKCEDCTNYQNGWCDIKRDSPDPYRLRTCTYWKHMTNYDRLISKAPEELAEYLYKHDFCKTPFSSDKQNWCDGDCGKCLAEWLKSPVEVDNG